MDEEEWTARRMFFQLERRGRSLPACLPDAEVIKRRSFEGSAGMIVVVVCLDEMRVVSGVMCLYL